jgi:hypothetical protein
VRRKERDNRAREGREGGGKGARVWKERKGERGGGKGMREGK